jgi:hypothetical protein
VTVVTHELLLARLVREWVKDVLPGDELAADGAANVAVQRYVDGASVSEACLCARGFAESWARHPSHQRVGGREQHRIAS